MKNVFLSLSLGIILFCACNSSNTSVNEQETPPVSNPENNDNNEPDYIELTPRKDIELTPAELGIISDGNKFAFQLFNSIHKNETKENFFISPLSASLALSMTSNGANGKTEQEMTAALGFEKQPMEVINSCYKKLTQGLLSADSSTELGIANSIWVNKGFCLIPSFIENNKSFYNAEIRELEFNDEATKAINKWCAEKTHNRIKEIIEEIDANVRLYLINALYFKAIWRHQFTEELTHKANFANLDGTITEVDMMQQMVTANYTENKNLQILEFRYGNEAFSMVILLPKKDINQTIESLNLNNWEKWMSSLSYKDIDFQLPKFKVEYERTLNEDLVNMGMKLAFTHNADFSKMSAQEELFIGLVKQKTFIETNEKGTEAAAVTIAEIEICDTPDVEPQYIDFHVNRPFIYLIKEESTGTILFMGKMTDMK